MFKMFISLIKTAKKKSYLTDNFKSNRPLVDVLVYYLYLVSLHDDLLVSALFKNVSKLFSYKHSPRAFYEDVLACHAIFVTQSFLRDEPKDRLHWRPDKVQITLNLSFHQFSHSAAKNVVLCGQCLRHCLLLSQSRVDAEYPLQ